MGRAFAGFLPDALADWVTGHPYHHIHQRMTALDIRVSGDRATVEDAVALCEGAFAYDLAMITASLVDLAEGTDEVLFAGFSKLQNQIKYGLTDPSAIAFEGWRCWRQPGEAGPTAGSAILAWLI